MARRYSTLRLEPHSDSMKKDPGWNDVLVPEKWGREGHRDIQSKDPQMTPSRKYSALKTVLSLLASVSSQIANVLNLYKSCQAKDFVMASLSSL